ncbi:MAG: hypothetical protein LBI28_02835 [Treponema sp.]|jgi:hypothetical protein|nr:hypothetical protein [Treponema sp.]
MRNIFFSFILFSFFLIPVLQAEAQSLSTTASTESVYNPSEFPQWVRDLRRWDIITFGLFPFSIFTVTFVTDTIRWYNANNFNFSEEGRRYAPWPLKSGNAPGMSNDEYVQTILIAAGVSAAVALIDLLIVTIKRNNERRRMESLPTGSVIIERRSDAQEPPSAADDADEGSGTP